MLTVGDLFSGIGGFSLGLERAGMRTAWFAETDPFASAVLRKHWPGVPNHGDVRLVRAGAVERVDVLCGGFPCQDISNAGKRAGLDGERSGLWREYARIIGDLRPRYVVVENVAALLGRGLGRVLGDLAALGFDAEWHCIPASAIGAPHFRDRVWILAYTNSKRPQEREYDCGYGAAAPEGIKARRPVGGSISPVVSRTGPDTERGKRSLGRSSGRNGRFIQSIPRYGNWEITDKPVLARGADGIPARLDRLKCLGNAVVPQIVEMIGRAIMEVDQCANSR